MARLIDGWRWGSEVDVEPRERRRCLVIAGGFYGRHAKRRDGAKVA